MANELVHSSAGTSLTQAEFEAVGLHVCNSQATGDLIYASSATQLSRLGVGTNGDFLTLTAGVPAWTSNKATTMYIGDTANAKMTLGLTINQGAADNEILSFKSSDIAHGVTTYWETDTFGELHKWSATLGGIALSGINEAAGIGAQIYGLNGTDDTAKTTSAAGVIDLNSEKINGTTTQACGANANLATIRNWGAARFIFDAEGSAHADVEWTTYAKHDDLAIIQSIEDELLSRESESQTSRRRALEEFGIIGKGSWHMEDGSPRAMVNTTKLLMLHHGALLQSYQRIQQLEDKNSELEKRLLEVSYVKSIG